MTDHVDPLVTDGVTQTHVAVVPDAVAVAVGGLYLATNQALGTVAHNAAAAQQSQATVQEACVVQGISILYTVSIGVITGSTLEVLTANDEPAAPASGRRQRPVRRR